MTRTRDVALAALAALSLAAAVAAGGADMGAGAAHRGVPLGVDPASAARFQGETFVCDGGAVSLDFSRVNDDYCDCADGADEPGTSACSNGSFHCRNRGHQPLNVPSSRVGDGVCDCCDGSDERAAGGAACANTCAGAGASRRDALRREVSDHRAGLRKKRALVDAAHAESKRWMEKRDGLVRDDAAARAESEAARAAADAASAERERAEEASKAFEVVVAPASSDDVSSEDGDAVVMGDYVDPENAGDVTAAADDGADPSDPGAEETDEERGQRIAAQWIKTDGGGAASAVPSESRETDDGSLDEPADSSRTRDAKQARLVDVDEDDDEASPAGPTALEPETETSSETKSRTKTSAFSSAFSWFGKAKASAGIFGRSESDFGENDTPEAREARARLAKAAAASSAAAAKATAAETRRDEKQKALDAVAADLARYVGARAEFQHMLGQCYEARVDKYAYRVCPFAESTQDGTKLGRMAPLEPETDHAEGGIRFHFRDGERCWNGPARSMTVSLACGAAPRLFAVTEPSRCEYAAVLATPAACEETVAAALEAELAAMEREIAELARGEELR